MLIVYNYDPITKEYTNEEIAQVNPLDKEEYLIPAHSTTIKPLDYKEGYAVVWIGNKWNYKEDHRGEQWYNIDSKQLETISFIGSLPDNYYPQDSKIANPPSEPYYQYDKDLDEWVGNPMQYKLFILSNFNTYWEEKINQPFEFEGFKYKCSWRELYTSIYTTLKDGIKNNYRLQDVDGNFNMVTAKTMKPIYAKMADINDEIYNDKQNLEVYFKNEDDFNKLQNKFNEWLNKVYS